MLKLNGDINVFLILSALVQGGGGGAVLFNNNFELQLHKEKKDDEGNLLALDLSIDNNRITLVNIYGPNSDCPDFYDKVRVCFLELDNDFFILFGDFNIALNQTLDTQSSKLSGSPMTEASKIRIGLPNIIFAHARWASTLFPAVIDTIFESARFASQSLLS